MLHSEIGRLIREKEPESPKVFLRKRGFTDREVRTLTQSAGLVQVRDSMMQRLCEAIGCTPNDIFRWRGATDSHLQALNMMMVENAADLLADLKQPELELLLKKAEQLVQDASKLSIGGEGRLFLNVARIAEQRQQLRPKVYLCNKGFTRMEVSKLFSSERKSVRVDMLTRLCVCFGCLPNDLYDWEGSTAHHLNGLRKVTGIKLTEHLALLPPDEIRRVLRELKRTGQ